MERLVNGLQKILNSDDGYIIILDQIIDFYEESLRKNSGIYYLVFLEVTGTGEYVELLTKKYFIEIHSKIATFLKKGAEKGIFRQFLNYHLCSISLVSIIMIHFFKGNTISYLSKYLNDSEISSYDKLKKHILNLFVC